MCGNLILTAACCVDYEAPGAVAFQGDLIQEIQTYAGNNLKVQILAVDLISDFAILGSPDYLEFGNESDAFTEYCAATTPVPICFKNYGRGSEFSVAIWVRKNIWVDGKAKLTDLNTRRITIESAIQIRGGTCGSAIVNEMGELIAVASNSRAGGENNGQEFFGLHPFIPKALPVWAVQKHREGLR